MKATAPKIDADKIYVALQSFAYHPYGIIRGGTRLRGSHEAVQKCPEQFVLDGADDAERNQALFSRFYDREPAQDPRLQPANVPKPLPDEQLVLCIRPVGRSAIGPDGRHQRIEVGTKISRRHPYVSQPSSADCFVSVTNNISRERALLATQTLRESRMGPDGELVTETLYAGQWADRDSEWVRSHPTMFTLPAPEI